MSFINIFIEKTCSICVKDNKLSLKNDEKSVEYPIEDINCILIDCLYNNISTFTINTLIENGATIIVCNEKHLPSCVILPYNKYYKKLSIIELQLNISKPKQKNLWQSIIKQKIIGQAECLKRNGKEGHQRLLKIAESVLSGDTNNSEAVAANIYFKNLFGSEFTREIDCVVNASLNYTYAIIRSLICRHLSARGFECSIGIFHKSQLNNFNLADDIIEPFRPIVDNFVINSIKDEQELNTSLKKKLFSIVNLEVVSGGQVHSLSNAIERIVESLISCYSGESHLIMPSIFGLTAHDYE